MTKSTTSAAVPVKRASTAVATRAPRQDMAAVDAALSAEALNIRQTISSGGASKLTINRNGRWQAPDGLDLGEEIVVVVVDFISANRFYPHTFDPANPIPPVCFAFGKVLGEMEPMPEAPEPQHDVCSSCELNQFGSRNKGKACKNTRELAVILEEDFENPEPKLYLISVPPTAIKSFDAFANLCSRALSGPPIKATVVIKAIPEGTYNTMVFADPNPNDAYAEHFALREEALDMLTQPVDLSKYKPSAPARAEPRAAPARGKR